MSTEMIAGDAETPPLSPKFAKAANLTEQQQQSLTASQEQMSAMRVFQEFWLYTVGHIFFCFVFTFSAVAIPLYNTTSGFSTENVSFWFGYITFVNMLPPWYQIHWFGEFTGISWKKIAIPVITGFSVPVYLFFIITQAVNKFPFPVLFPVTGCSVYMSVDMILMWVLPKYFFSDLKTEEDHQKFKKNFKKFTLFCILTGGYFFSSILYLFLFAYANSTGNQIIIQIGYNIVAVSIKEVMFKVSGGDNLSIYFVEFASDFFTFMALPNITSVVTFCLAVLMELSGLLYQAIRLTEWWFLNVEVKYLLKFRNYLLGGGIIDECVAYVAFESNRVIHLVPARSEEDLEREPSYANLTLDSVKTTATDVSSSSNYDSMTLTLTEQGSSSSFDSVGDLSNTNSSSSFIDNLPLPNSNGHSTVVDSSRYMSNNTNSVSNNHVHIVSLDSIDNSKNNASSNNLTTNLPANTNADNNSNSDNQKTKKRRGRKNRKSAPQRVVTWRMFQRNVCRTMMLTALGKIFSPLIFACFFSFLTKSYNNKYYPWRHMTDATYHKILAFSLSACGIYVVGALCCCLFAFLKYKLNVFKDAVIQSRERFWLCTANVLGALLFPLVMIPYHSNTWFFFFDQKAS